MSHRLTAALASLLAATLLCLLPACSGRSNDADPAAALLTRARLAVDDGRWAEAINAVAELDSLHPSAVEQRRQAMPIKARAQEGLAVEELAVADSLMVGWRLLADSLTAQMRWVDNPVEGYYTAKTTQTSWPLRARLDRSGVLTLVATLSNPGRTPATALTLTDAAGASASSARVAVDGELNEIAGSTQTITLTGAMAQPLAELILKAPPGQLTLAFDGSGRKTSLPAAQTAALKLTVEAAHALASLEAAAVEHQRLERVLETARRHMAVTSSSAQESQPN